MVDTDRRRRLVQLLTELAPHIRLTSHSPGRSRLKVSLGGLRIALAADLGDFHEVVLAIPGVSSARVNLLARSVTVHYDERVIDGDFWELLSRAKESRESLENFRTRIARLFGE